MVTQRQLDILKLVLTHNEVIDLEDLKKELDKSERTIRYDISNLRNLLSNFDVELRYKAANGFYIPINQRVIAETVLTNWEIELNGPGDIDFNETLNQELLMVLGTRPYVTMNTLIDVLFLSERSIAEYIQTFNTYYHGKFEIKNQRGQGYYLEGNEYYLRKELAKILRTDMQKKTINREQYMQLPHAIRQALTMDEFIHIAKNYKKFNATYQVWLKTSTYNLIFGFLIVVFIRRKLKICLEVETNQHFEGVNNNMISYCEGVLQGMMQGNEDETDSQSLLKILLESDVNINDRLDHDPEVMEVLDEIVEFLQENRDHDLEFNYRSLKHDLHLHFQNFLSRQNSEDDVEENMILDEIQIKYAEFYELAIHCAHVFDLHFGTRLSHKEISYIAIYLYKNVLKTEGKKRVLVVCATGRGLSTLLVTRIRHVFPQLEIVDSLSYYQLESLKTKEDVDFVISTIPIENSIYPVIKISNVLSNADIQMIHEHLNDWHKKAFEYKNTRQNYFENIALTQAGAIHGDLHAYSTIISEIILSLISFTTEISADYPMTYDEILGLIIHLVMAIPRWFEYEPQNDTESEMLYKAIEINHEPLVATMNIFFTNIESALYISISKRERLAFYQYILRRNEQ